MCYMLIYIFLKVGNKKDSTSKTKKKTDELVFINIKYFLNQKTSKINFNINAGGLNKLLLVHWIKSDERKDN